MKENKQALLHSIEEYLQTNKQEIVHSLLNLMRIPSVQGEPLKNAPYGKGCDDMINATASLMEQNGFKTVRRNDLGYTYSLLEQGGKKTIGMFSHGDVVPVDGEWLICPPFEPIIKDGFIFGRGCNDDKSGIIEMLYATKIIRDLHIPFQSNVLLFTGVNEETGMGDIKAFVKTEQMPDASLIIDGGSYPCDLGERTFYRFYLENKQPFKTILAFNGGSVFNIVLPEVEVILPYSSACFEQLQNLTNGKENYILCEDKTNIFITAKGLAAPVTRPDEGHNAVLCMIELLLQCAYISQEDKQIVQEAYTLLADSYGRGLHIEHTDSRFGRLTVGNGIARLVDGKLKLSFDVRAGTEFALDELRKTVQAVTCANWNCIEQNTSVGYIVQEDNRYRKALAKGYRFAMGEAAPLGGDLMSGGTHARYLKNAFPVTNMNKDIIPNYPMPKGHGSYHQPDEKLHVDGFVDGIRILICLLLALDEEVNK